MRLRLATGRALDRDFSLKYALRQDEVKIGGPTVEGSDDGLNAYLVREEPREGGSYSAGHGVLLLPDASGWRSSRTRRLADRLAVFCSCLVLLPDLQRGQSGWDGPATTGGGFESWLSGLPPARIASDLRECTVYMRADLRVRRMGLVGIGLGGGQALHEASRDAALLASTVVAICPIRFSVEEALEPKVPLLCVYGADSAAEARVVRARLGGDRGTGGVSGAVAVQPRRPISDGGPPVRGAGGSGAATGATGGGRGRSQARQVPSISALTKLTVGELRTRLSERGLPADGLKKELAARLREAVAAETAAAEDTPPASPAVGTAAAVLLSSAGDVAAARSTASHLVVELSGAAQLCSTAMNSPAENSPSGDAEDQGEYPSSASDGSAVEGAVPGEEAEGDGDGLAGEGMVEGSDEVLLSDDNLDASELELNDALLVIEGWLTAHLHTNTPLVDGPADRGKGYANGAASRGADEDEDEPPSAVDARAMETAETPPARSEEIRRPRPADDLGEDA